MPSHSRSRGILAVLVVLVGALATPVAAQEEPAADRPDAQSEEPQEPSPRSAMTEFLEAARAGDYLRAARKLDFSEVGGWPGEAEAKDRARAVHRALDRFVGRIDLEELSGDPEGRAADGPESDHVARIESDAGSVDVRMVRAAGGEWLLGPGIVARAPELLEEAAPSWVEVLPEPLFEIQFLTLELWQWLALLALVPIASGLGALVASIVLRLVRGAVRRTRTEWDDALVDAFSGPLRLAVAVGIFLLGSLFLALPLVALEWIGTVAEVLVVLAVAWFLLRVVDVVAHEVQGRVALRDAAAAGTLVPLARRITKVFVFLIAAVSLIHNLGFNVAGLLAGLGVGGLAVALAAQKTLENLFGGFSVIADRPVRVGEFCKVGDHIGTVEDIGLRSTRIRTLDRTIVTIPNSEFSTVRIENFAKRDRIRLYAVLQVGYDTTPDQLRYLLVEIRRMLYAHPRMAADPCRIKFVNFGAYSLDLEIFAYVQATDWADFLDVREDVYLRIMDIVAESGAYFAYPSQTLYMGRHDGLDPERTKAAEGRVDELRRSGKLPIPGFTSELVSEVDDTLPWPPEGSAVGVNRA